ncbi:MAG: hypothetical protein ACM3SY_13750 [Candidatus Omnitrophota bacterium]
MHIIREIRTINADSIKITIPHEFKAKEVEILILPLENVRKKRHPGKKFQFTTFKCNGKKMDFSRDDAYDEKI